MRYFINTILSLLFILVLLLSGFTNAEAEDDILDFLPAILANAEKRPLALARWRVTNEVACSSFESKWTVTDGESNRVSELFSQFSSPETSPFSEVEPGPRTFTWTLNTRGFRETCGVFRNSFAQDMKSGFDYRFILVLNDSGALSVSTIVTRR